MKSLKNISIRLKITLWFSIVLAMMTALTYFVVLSVSDSILQKRLQDNLVQIVEDNVDEVEYWDKEDVQKNYNIYDLYIAYGDGYLEIDDDFLDMVNGIVSALYRGNGALLYGENPIASKLSDVEYRDGELQKKTINGELWYVFDRKIEGDELSDLWLRGVVSSKQGEMELSSVMRLSLVLMMIVLVGSILGGYFIAGKSLSPIRQITETAAQIGQGRDLKKRIHLGDGEDELHRLANTFNEMFDRLEASFETERQFTVNASHELRTPMAVIMAQCEYTLEEEESLEEYKEALLVIRRQGGKMTRLIEDMLTFTRMDRRIEQLEKASLNLSALVESVSTDMSYLQEKNITLTYEVEPDLWVVGNSDLLIRLLTNLISNAYRYGRENGMIHVTLHAQGDQVMLAVADDGIGIAKEEQEKIFRRFYQSDRARTGAGTGLGLAMAHEIAHFHGGELWVESAFNEGSTFFFKMQKK
ncbi:MAG: ATP-binding protein [Roseburia sp.]